MDVPLRLRDAAGIAGICSDHDLVRLYLIHPDLSLCLDSPLPASITCVYSPVEHSRSVVAFPRQWPDAPKFADPERIRRFLRGSMAECLIRHCENRGPWLKYHPHGEYGDEERAVNLRAGILLIGREYATDHLHWRPDELARECRLTPRFARLWLAEADRVELWRWFMRRLFRVVS